jgi:hypothetical protein
MSATIHQKMPGKKSFKTNHIRLGFTISVFPQIHGDSINKQSKNEKKINSQHRFLIIGDRGRLKSGYHSISKD